MAEFRAWRDYAEIEPFGSHFDDLRAGQICAVTANANRDSKRTPDPFVPMDFLPWSEAGRRHTQPMTYANADAHAAALMRVMGVRPS